MEGNARSNTQTWIFNDAQQAHVGRHTCTNKHGGGNSHVHTTQQITVSTASTHTHTVNKPQTPPLSIKRGKSAHFAHPDYLCEANTQWKPLTPALTASPTYSGQHQHSHLSVINILTPASSISTCTSTSSNRSLLTPTVQQITDLPVALNRNSPRGCGSCGQPLVSASSLVCRQTHAKTLFTAEPDGKRDQGEEGKGREREKERRLLESWTRGSNIKGVLRGKRRPRG